MTLLCTATLALAIIVLNIMVLLFQKHPLHPTLFVLWVTPLTKAVLKCLLMVSGSLLVWNPGSTDCGPISMHRYISQSNQECHESLSEPYIDKGCHSHRRHQEFINNKSVQLP